ncbi:surface protease GP63 [Trypanosoma theileri]|uniref:Leishmanolysin-like peptidase n=1 Tax=Trypanosoma theileri TaxID=67003 RepID=A0A1X0NI96_9TRYP|nr:surface protease GP63 [Trypanosoma theileri]ORC83909.1 surface protease GP63 [Trypanosoma theileri]
MRRLFLFAPLLLLYCTLVTHAVTEHHQCMFDRVTTRIGADFKVDDRDSIGMQNLRGRRVSNANGRSSPTFKTREDPSNGWDPIRIKLVTDNLKKDGHHCSDKVKTLKTLLNGEFSCTKDDVLTPEKEKILVKEILPEAIKLHEERLFVERLKGPIVVPQFSKNDGLCSQLIPEEHKTTGVPEADMVLFVAAQPTTNGTFAWAATCATLDSDGRPVIGIINYGPRYIVATPQRVRVAAHEIAHALGFNFELMKRKDMVRNDVNLRNKSNVALVNSENTLRETMDHYNCDSTEGMELRVVLLPRQLRTKGNNGRLHEGRPNPREGRQRSDKRTRAHPHVQDGRRSLAPRVVTASVQEEYELGKSHSNAIDGRLTGKESVGSVVQERRGEEGFSSAKFTQNVHHSSNVFSKRRSLYLQATVAESQSTCSPGKPVETEKGGTRCIVETKRFLPENMEIITQSHWSRRNAKDELMVGLVGAGYYTALTLGAFADLGYYKVNWTMAEQMSWGNKAGCEFLNDKCVNDGETKFPNMFCTTEATDGTESLQCTSDRQSLGSCSSFGAKKKDNKPLPEHFRYFSENNKVGSQEPAQMDYCPFIKAKHGYSCISGEQSNMPESKIGINSRCVEGKDLKADNNAAVGAVCVEVSCKFKKVIVRYSGNDKWYSCPEGENLTVNGTALQGKIVCPKYADVCNTINKTLDESQGPSTDPDTVEKVQTSQTEGETTTGTTKPSENDGNFGVSLPVVQNEASTTTESNPSETKEENITSFLNGQNNNIVAKKGIDGSLKANVFASVMFVFLTLSAIMLP